MNPRNASRSGQVLQPVIISVICLLLFVHFSQANFRSPEGYLGRTTPPMQDAILKGSAPAPYVYRQGVPRLRFLLGRILLPGHAAVAVDLFFAVVCIAAGLSLGSFALGSRLAGVGAVVCTFTAIAAYPSGAPEGVATVAFSLAIGVLLVRHRHREACAVSLLAVIFRPEVPILLGVSAAAAMLILGGSDRAVDRWKPPARTAYYLLTVLIGLIYLVLARYLLWPGAKLAPGTAALTLVTNLRTVVRWPGLLFGSLLTATGVIWVVRAIRRTYSHLEHVDSETAMALGLYVIAWVAWVVFFGDAGSVGLFVAVLPLVLLLAPHRLPLARAVVLLPDEPRG